jgi:hypothetical protein
VIALNALEYDGTTGAIHIAATANNEKEAAQYIKRLKETQYFTQVDYTGYAQVIASSGQTSTSGNTTSTGTTSTGFGFSADAYLKAGDAQ